MRLAGALSLCALALAPPLGAQTVRGTVSEEGSGVALRGALVALVSTAGDSIRAGVLTDDQGRFRLRAPPGTWRIRAEHLGHASVRSGILVLGPGDDVEMDLVVPVQAVALEALSVTATRRACEAPSDGPATALLWDDARKALENALWAREGELVGFEALLYERRLEPRTLRVQTDESERRAAVGVRPFSTLVPEELAERGFVQRTDSGTYYFAPDERVLLSDVFLAGHCFELRRSPDRPELVGLAFRPARGRDRVDIQGVLWLDDDTRELRFVEYGYTNLDLDVPTDEVGGRLQFQRLPTGAWIPRSWWIRMPVVEVQRTTRLGIQYDHHVLAGIRERGGEVLAVKTRRDGRIEQLDRPRVQGLVYDSTRGSPLAGAEVLLEGTGHRTRADARGRFLLAAPEGDYRLSFRHPRLDSLGLEPPTRPLAMRSGVLRQARLAIPGEATLLTRACSANAAGVIAGSVRDGEGRPIPGARVRFSWRPASEPVRQQDVPAGRDGDFLFCSAPLGIPVNVRAIHEDRTSEARAVTVYAEAPGRLTLRVDTLRLGRVIGRVADATNGQPLQGAVIRLRGTGLQTVTGENGRFSLRDVPPGPQILEVEHIAYGARSDTLSVASGATVSVQVDATVDAIRLDPITVTAERQYRVPGLAGFYERLEQGHGRFITAEQIELRQAGRLSEVLRAVPGLSIMCSTPDVTGSNCIYQFNRARLMDAQGRERVCPVQFFLDGTATAQTAIETIRPSFIEGVEIYNGLSEVPPRFRRGPDTRCGVVVVWLKAGA